MDLHPYRFLIWRKFGQKSFLLGIGLLYVSIRGNIIRKCKQRYVFVSLSTYEIDIITRFKDRLCLWKNRRRHSMTYFDWSYTQFKSIWTIFEPLLSKMIHYHFEFVKQPTLQKWEGWLQLRYLLLSSWKFQRVGHVNMKCIPPPLLKWTILMQRNYQITQKSFW